MFSGLDIALYFIFKVEFVVRIPIASA